VAQKELVLEPPLAEEKQNVAFGLLERGKTLAFSGHPRQWQNPEPQSAAGLGRIFPPLIAE